MGLKIFWTNNITPALALGTCSSIATIPANLKSWKMQVPHILVTIPLGAPLHKDGSSMSSIIKIAVILPCLVKTLLILWHY
jgi:Na+/H+-dicarboxylate symporter